MSVTSPSSILKAGKREKNMQENKNNQDKKWESEIQELPKFDFMKEQIKERPLNKKKLLRRTVLTVSMAMLFGLVACLTVLVLEPVFSNWIYPEEKAENIVIPAETEEILPEDMVLDDEELKEEEDVELVLEMVPEKKEDELETYQKIYMRLQKLTGEVSRSLVTVKGVSSDTDWFDNMYESGGQSVGVIVAENGKEYLILTESEKLKTVEQITVTFCDDTQVAAQIKMTDPISGLAVLAVEQDAMGASTLEKIEIGNLGSSNHASLKGSPVIALGSPLGVSRSVVYGAVTSNGNQLHMPDSKYRLITTDMYGSSKASGVLINLQGQIIGIINQDYNDSELKNMISAIGISELKKPIERLSNGNSRAYLGIYGMDVTREANEELQVPYGAYVTEIAMDSPAMQAGIQSGDVIVSLNGRIVGNYGEYIAALNGSTPESTVNISIMRKNQEEYKSMSFVVTLGELK